ncbi:MAG: SDR family NAD(P)-dependent oxidoreductase, partial [bacterium]|nr:SDR family NAD(P)-dependent oxidoreductase [bacterium]
MLKNKVVLITGGRRGMGRADALILARYGAKVAVTDINQAECQEVVNEIKKQGGKAIALQMDVTDKAQVEQAVEKTAKELGGLDILVNNAGIVEFKPFLELTENDWDKTININ